MNDPHQNARTTVHSRELMVARRAEGRPVGQIAKELGVSARTVWKWLRRHREGGRACAITTPDGLVGLPGRTESRMSK